MKKLMMIISAILFSVSIPSDIFAAGCTVCETGSDECHRVMIGNTVHIFYGVEKPCPEGIE
ncbi:hypothetical protein M3O96_16410 [Aquiflexum sp. TKW24L]|uniref:hypothetical protein n=1 Tax=Aquiflexum sp. TKW24L TaxID=2942212 RepID=UPI0020BEF035|nr:hypothetical protein [Aquiflexum sp. TKW24L]MCL6260689.1 hypothetical protein [Aquiflexum sp. TKW24L]